MASSINADNGVSSGSAGLKSSADSSGVLQLQTNGTTALSIDASQNVSFTNQPTYSGGTANGVAYLNGSKVLTTGSALVFDGSNLGLGVTPSAWGTSGAVFKALELGAAGTGIIGLSSPAGSELELLSNAYYNSGWKYAATGRPALRASLNGDVSGAFSWNIAGSGTAGNAISFTQAMTLDASGQLVIGDTTADTKFNLVGGTARISGTRTAGSFIDITPNNTGSNGVTLGVSYYGSGSYGPLKFSTSGVERARITSAGDLDLYITAAKDGALRWTSGGGGALQGLIYCNGNPEVVVQSGGTGGVKLTSGATSWVSASDTRFKDIIEPIANAVDKVNTLSAVIYSFKDDETAERRVGLIAQELLAVLPEAVHVPKKEEEMMGVRYTETIPLLVAAIKEQSAIITQLQADVAALKG